MGKTRNGHAWSLYTSNKTHELASRILVCYTAVFSVVTQRSSPLTAAENRNTFLSRD